MTAVDLNCDLGESFGRYTLGLDDCIIPLVSSVNVACGMHAGDPLVMQKTVKAAVEGNTSLGAHPGYPDLQGFGRRDMNLSPRECYAYVLYQVSALQGFCKAQGARLNHVKPHGQLYNRCAADREAANAVVQAIHDVDPQLVVVGLANSQLIYAAQAHGMTAAQEFFADRNYTDEGLLVSRSDPQALISNESFAVARAVKAVQTGYLESVSGKRIALKPDTICVHGDNQHALQFVQQLRDALTQAGISIQAPKA